MYRNFIVSISRVAIAIIFIGTLILSLMVDYKKTNSVSIFDYIDSNILSVLFICFIMVVGYSAVISLLKNLLRDKHVPYDKSLFSRFLNSFFDAGDREVRKEGNNYSDFERRLESIENNLSTGLADDQIEEITNNAANRVEDGVATSLMNKVEEKYDKEIKESRIFEIINESLIQIQDVLEKERSTVSTRSAVNLLFGFIAAILGIWVLYDLTIDYTSKDIGNITLQFFSRLSVAIIIEVFAYFFLNLYRGGLQEIKYYRNEITNVKSQATALKLALLTNADDKALSALISKLANTERNFILKKGETTQATHANRLEREQDNQLTETLAKQTSVLEKIFKQTKAN